MDSGIIKKSLRELERHISSRFPATGWYFSSKEIPDTVNFEKDTWTCMYKMLERVLSGGRVCFSVENIGCSGASFYLGFKKPGIGAGRFLAEQEKLKKTIKLADAFYENIHAKPAEKDYLIWERIENIENDVSVNIINLWIEALSLSGLVALANYDRKSNENVIFPFASGCQSIWTLPFKEEFNKFPKAVIGVSDPVARSFLPDEVLSFSLPAKRFVEICENIPGSFLEENSWTKLAFKQEVS